MKTIITDNEIRNKSVDEIKVLKTNQQNIFQLTDDALYDSYKEQNTHKMKFLKDSFNLKLAGNGQFHVDIATEEGNEKMAKFLVEEFKSQPSLYAKQLAHINGYSGLSFWMDKYAQQRNDIGIDSVHKRFNKKIGKWIWNDCIPIESRY